MLRKQTSIIARRPKWRVAGIVTGLALLVVLTLGYGPSVALGWIGSPASVQAQGGTCSNVPGDPNPCALAQRRITSNCPRGECIIQKYVQPLMNLLAASVGLAVTASFITAGIRYASSADNPQKVSEAKQRMVTSAMVLIGFFTFYALMHYLIPGGLV